MRSIKHCVNHRIIDLCNRAMKLETLDEKIKSFLPEELKNVCKAGSFEQGCLTLITSDAVWATPLNFLKSELRDYLRKENGLRQLSSITIKILPPILQPATAKNQAKKLPDKARDTILELAENCKDTMLKQALFKLAK